MTSDAVNKLSKAMVLGTIIAWAVIYGKNEERFHMAVDGLVAFSTFNKRLEQNETMLAEVDYKIDLVDKKNNKINNIQDKKIKLYKEAVDRLAKR